MGNERKFLHDLAGPLTVCRISLKLISKEIEKLSEEEAKKFSSILKKMDQLQAALGKLDDLHAMHKEAISNSKRAA